MRLGHQGNAWGAVIGHPAGVTSIKDLFYLTPTEITTILDGVASAGFQSVELFDGNLAEFADHPEQLGAALENAGLALSGVYSGANFVFPQVLPEELRRIRRACEWAAALGAENLIVGGGAQRAEPPTGEDYSRLSAALDEVAQIAEGHGLVASFHPHLGTIVESPEQLERVLEHSRIDFCPDTGHLQAGGGDPVSLIRTYRDRITCVHLKDLDDSSAFVPLGDGILDVAGVVAVLEDSDFGGWTIVETDGWAGDPSEGAQRSMNHLRELLR